MNALIRIIAALVVVVCIVFIFPHLLTLRTSFSDYALYNESLNETWPQTTAELAGDFTLAKVRSARQKNMPELVYYPIQYTYTVAGKTCRGTRFDFESMDGRLTEVKPDDGRINDFLRAHCVTAKNEQSTGADLYRYHCQKFQVFYKPDDVCESYITRTRDPEATRNALKQRMILLMRIGATFLVVIVAAVMAFVKALKQNRA